MAFRRLAAAAALVALAAVAAAPEEEAAASAALAADDQCAAGDEACALNALQLQSRKVAAQAAASANATDASTSPSCMEYGCQGFVRGRSCQCNPQCQGFGSCCSDYHSVCQSGGSYTPPAQTMSKACYHSSNIYSLDWEAQGNTFFDDFTFVTQDDVHGAHQFTTREEAHQQKTITTDNGQAQLRYGGIRFPSYAGEAYKRYSVNIHTNKAWEPTPGFIAALHYSKLPAGCGVWPSFWAMNSDKVWPHGGELDILEYANYEENKVTFHIAEQCALDTAQVERCAPRGSTSAHADGCQTSYFEGKLGCMPKQRQPSGEFFSQNPGVIAAEWADDHITIFHIPEAEIPQDLKDNMPVPGTWGKWVLAYLPFKEGCTKYIGPQELVLNMQLCGDWAGATWDGVNTGGQCPKQSNLWNNHMCESGLSSPTDCCTKYVTGGAAEIPLRYQQYMDIKYLKVFTANGEVSKSSGTFVRGGVPLSA